MAQIVLITGATGKQGGSALTKLLELAPDTKIRAITRNTESGSAKALSAKGVEVVKADLLDPDSLATAFKGVTTAFLVTIPGDDEVTQGKNFVKAAKDAGVEHLVFTSVEGSDRASFVPHFDSKWQVEKEIRAVGFPIITILRPTAFMNNFPISGFGRFLVLGLFNTMLDGKAVQVISVKDIGFIAGEAMAKPDSPFRGQVVPLAGDEVTVDQILDAYGKVVYQGKSRPWKAYIPWFMVNMLPYDFRMMGKFFRENGYEVKIDELRKDFPELQDLEAHLVDQTKSKTN